MKPLCIVLIVLTVVLVLAAIGVGVYFYYKNRSFVTKFGRNFQHNKTHQITDQTYTYVYKYKQELLKQMTKLLDDLGIEFVISHGNLIEYERKSPIYHDDDLDLRFNTKHFDKWMEWCRKQPSVKIKQYNLKFDARLFDGRKQLANGIQVNVMKEPTTSYIACNIMDVHADLVASHVKDSFWTDYDIDFSKRRQITYMGVKTWAPSKEDTARILSNEYGRNYIIPQRPYKQNEFKLLI